MQQLNPGQVVWGSRERAEEGKSADARRVLITGVSGFIGRRVSSVMRAEGALVAGVSRSPLELGVQGFSWSDEDLQVALRGADAVVNLAGGSLMARRWNAKAKEQMLGSRVETTRKIVQAIAELDREERPEVLINASAIGYYGTHPDQDFTENDPVGSDFLADVCEQWEQEALKAEKHIARVVPLRIGTVLGRGGGAYQKMLPLFRTGIGGRIGNGKQWMSWIHSEDLAAMIIKIIETPRLTGPINGVAPVPVTNDEFSRTLARLVNMPCWTLPGFALKAAVGDMADYLLKGQKVLPAKAGQAGFKFRFPTIEEALINLLG